MLSLFLNGSKSLESYSFRTTSEENYYFYYTFYFRLVLSFVSAIGSCFIIISYFLIENLRKYIFRLIVHLAIADLIFSFSFFLINENANYKNKAFCEFQAFLFYASSLSSIFWTSIIAYSLYRMILVNSAKKVMTYKNIFLFIGYFIPFFIALIPLYFKKYGPQSLLTDKVDSWCGIRRNRDNNTFFNISDNFTRNKHMNLIENEPSSISIDNLEKIIFFSNENEENFTDYEAISIDFWIRVFPICLCLLINLIFYIKIVKLYVMVKFKSQLLVLVHHRIIFILLLPILCWSCEIMLRILEFTNSVKSKGENELYVYIIEIIDSIILPLYGAGNFLIYACNPFVIQEWKKICCVSNEIIEKENEIGSNFNINSREKEEESKKSKEERLLDQIF